MSDHEILQTTLVLYFYVSNIFIFVIIIFPDKDTFEIILESLMSVAKTLNSTDKNISFNDFLYLFLIFIVVIYQN